MFPDEAVVAIADRAVEKDTGARGLRAILEEVMLDIMFDIPSKKGVQECVITPGVVKGREEPLLVYEQESLDESDADRSATA